MRVLVLNPPSKVMPNVVRDLQYGCWCKGRRIGGTTVPPITLLYIASVLKRDGHEVRLLEALAQKVTFEETKQVIKGFDVVITLTSTMTFNEDAEILGDFKKINERLITIIFGSHPTFMPQFALKEGCIDIIVRFEPEFIIRDVLRELQKGTSDWKKVRGIGYLDNAKVVLNEPYPYIENLDELPFPDRTLLPKDANYFNPLVKRTPYTSAITSRGCPAKCIFCVVPPFYGPRLRCRSAESVLEEFQQIEKEGYKEIFIRDETFTSYKSRNAKICEEMIKRKMDLTWICNTRVDAVNLDMLRLMKQAGCHMVKFGVESGSQETLDNLKKDVKIEDIRNAFKLCRQIGLKTHAHFMIGAPSDTLESIDKTIKLIGEIEPTTITTGICSPYAGTPLFEMVRKVSPQIKDGSALDFTKLHVKSFFSEAYCKIPPEDLERQLRRVYRSFYMRPSYIIRWLGRVNSMAELNRVFKAGRKLILFSIQGEKLQQECGSDDE